MPDVPRGDLAVTIGIDDGAVVLRFAGELDLATAPFAHLVVERAFAGQPDRVVLDLSALSFMDCRGIDVLDRAAEHAKAAGASVSVRGATGVRARLVELSVLSGDGAGAGAGEQRATRSEFSSRRLLLRDGG